MLKSKEGAPDPRDPPEEAATANHMQDPENPSGPGKDLPARPAPAPQYDIAPLGGGSRDLDLSGAEQLSTVGKMGVLHPHILLGMMAILAPAAPHAASFAVFTWIVLNAMAGKRGSKALSRVRDRSLDTPSTAVRKGFGALATACLLALICGGLGEAPLSFAVLNGAWAGLTLAAVRSGSKTDAQTGWMAGATSMTAAALFFGVPLAFYCYNAVPWVVLLTPFLAAGSLWQSWKFMGGRGTGRSRAALNATILSGLATLAFLPATAALIGFSAFEAMCHFSVAFGSIMLPIWTMRDRLKPAIGAGEGSSAGALPESNTPALPSE
jgi:hypothetical protein